MSPADASRPAALAVSRAERVIAVSEGWECAGSPPGAHADPGTLEHLSWVPAEVPGTVAGALRAAGIWTPDRARDLDLDTEDWWFRTAFDADEAHAGEEVDLMLAGLATVTETYLNGELVHAGESMFEPAAIPVAGRLKRHNELAICARALAPLLAPRRKPRARWRTRLVAEANLRFVRTMLLGRAPGFAPGPAPVGPWGGVSLRRRERVALDALTLRPRLEGGEGVLAVHARVRTIAGADVARLVLELDGPSGAHGCELALESRDGLLIADGELRVPDAAPWWPHTHGEPALHEVRLDADADGERLELARRRVGFRALAFGADRAQEIERDGIDLHVNGVRVFARGALWTPADPVALAAPADALRAQLQRVRDAGMNIVRLPGTGAYQTDAFHDLCDELGILVWQDLMFANLDYPVADDTFRAAVEREARTLLERVGGRPSLAVVCGNSEVEQQAAMFGVEPSLGRGELFGELLPRIVAEADIDAAWLPSAPCGGALPFRPDRGVANYFGVGGYRRPLTDVRFAAVRFASECLALSNVPDEAGVERAGGADGLGERWKAAIPADAGTDWDFEDVRDHYLALLFGADPAGLRESDPGRYLELSRAVSGELMSEVFGEWRRAGSPCGGGLILWLRDLLPGAGWGVLDDEGAPKAAYHHLARALAPVCVWTTDEGLAGVAVHVANDRPTTLGALLRVDLYSDFERRVGDARVEVEIAPHSQQTWDLEDLLGRFVDASWAYRFGPPAQDLIVATLEGSSGIVSQAFRFPAARPAVQGPADLGLRARIVRSGADARIVIASRRFAYGVRVHAAGFEATGDAVSIEPGGERTLALRALSPDAELRGGHLTALNLAGAVTIEAES